MRHHDEDLELDVELEEAGSGSMLGPFLLGLAVGAGAALLLAPRTGSEMRRDLGRLLGQLGEQGPSGAVDGARASASGLVDRARSGAMGRVDALRGAMESQVDRVRDAVEEGKLAAREAGDELRRQLAEAREVYRAGAAGTPPRKPAPRPDRPAAAPRVSAAEEVVVTETVVEDGRGDLAR